MINIRELNKHKCLLRLYFISFFSYKQLLIMKRTTISTFALLFFIPLLGQVGINTTVPYINSIFHIDSQGNNTSSTLVSSSETSDDIIIDSSGNIGVGTVNPTAKLHIDASNSSLNPLRIADGSQGTGKYLFSDNEGKVTWKNKPVPNGIVYYSRTPKTYPRGVNTELPVEVNAPGYNRITIPQSGNYIFTLRWWGSIPSLRNLNAGDKIMSGAAVELYKAGTSTYIDRIVIYTPVASGGSIFEPRFSFTVSMFASGVNAGDIFYLTINPTTDTNYGVYDWATGAALNASQINNTIYYPSVMVYNI